MKKWPKRKINQTPCGESCHLLTKVDVRSEKVLTGELGTIKPSALPYITTQKIEKNPEKMPKSSNTFSTKSKQIIIDRVPLSSWCHPMGVDETSEGLASAALCLCS